MDQKSQKQQVIEENISEQQIIEEDISAKIIIDSLLFVLSMESQSTVQAGRLLCTHRDVIRQEVSEMDPVRAFVEVNYKNTAEMNQKLFAEEDCIQNAETALKFYLKNHFHRLSTAGGTISPLVCRSSPLNRPRLNPGGLRFYHRIFLQLFSVAHRHRFQHHPSL